MTEASTVTTTSQLMTVSPSGSASTTNLPNPANKTVIPDGNGGALVQSLVPANQNQSQVSTQVIDAGGANPTATISNFAGGDTVLGDQGTYFMTDGNQVVCVDEASGNELWRWKPASRNVQIMAATAGGGVAARNIVGNQEDVVRLDSNGNPRYDTWGTAGGGAGYGVLSTASYTAENVWVGESATSVISGMIGSPLVTADDSGWAYSGGSTTGNNGSMIGCPCLWQTTNTSGSQDQARPIEPIGATETQEETQPRGNLEVSDLAPPSDASCPICNLQSPQCTTMEGAQSTYVIIVGDPGLGEHNVGNGFNLAAQQRANDLQSQGHRVVACRASSAQDFDNVLIQHGYIDGGVIYFGHSGPYTLSSVSGEVLARRGQHSRCWTGSRVWHER
jgi:hypothetical protein